MKTFRTILTSALLLASSLAAQAQVAGLNADQAALISGSWVKLETTPKDLKSEALWTYVDTECQIKMIDGKKSMFGRDPYKPDGYEYLREIVPNIETITGHMYFAPANDRLAIIEQSVFSLSKTDIFKVTLTPAQTPWVRATFKSGVIITENGVDRLEFPFPNTLDWSMASIQRPDGQQVFLAKSNDQRPNRSGTFMQCTK